MHKISDNKIVSKINWLLLWISLSIRLGGKFNKLITGKKSILWLGSIIVSGNNNNVFIGDTFNNLFESGCVNNTFLRGCHDTTLKWNSVNNLFNENVCFTTGSVYNQTIPIGNTTFSMTITKTIQKVNEATLVSYLDPITYAYQIILLE